MWSQIIQSGNDLLSSLFGNAMNMRLQRGINRDMLSFQHDANQAQIDLVDMQNRFSKAMWDEENAYNSPLAQVRRLRAAGLSSAAAAQAVSGVPAGQVQSSSGSLSGSPSLTAPQLDINSLRGFLPTGESIIGLMRQVQAFRSEKAQADVAEETKTSNIQNILTDTDARKWALATAIQDFQQSAQSFPFRLESLRYKAKSDSFLPKISKLAVAVQRQNYLTAVKEYSWIDKLNDAKLEEISSGITKILAEAKESLSQADLNVANKHYVEKQSEGLDYENVVKRIDSVLKKYGSPSQPTAQFGALVASGELKAEEVDDFLKAARSYVESSGRVFDGTPVLRSLFVRTLNPGIGQDFDENAWSHGTLNKIFDFVRGSGRGFIPLKYKDNFDKVLPPH